MILYLEISKIQEEMSALKEQYNVSKTAKENHKVKAHEEI